MMNITIQIPDLSNFKQKMEEAAKNLVNKEVPLGKTILVTSLVLTGVQIVVFRKMRISILVTKQ